jgi:hypothetical protein
LLLRRLLLRCGVPWTVGVRGSATSTSAAGRIGSGIGRVPGGTGVAGHDRSRHGRYRRNRRRARGRALAFGNGNFRDRNSLSEQALDAPQQGLLFVGDQGQGDARGAGAAGATDAVDIVLGRFRVRHCDLLLYQPVHQQFLLILSSIQSDARPACRSPLSVRCRFPRTQRLLSFKKSFRHPCY